MSRNHLRRCQWAVILLASILSASLAWDTAAWAGTVTVAKITVRAGATKDADNEISVTTTGGLKEVAKIFLSKESAAEDGGEKANEKRAGAITTQMTRAKAEAKPGVGADVIEITAIGAGVTICAIDHNGLNGEEINVNPNNLANGLLEFRVEDGIGLDGFFELALPAYAVATQVDAAGLTASEVITALFNDLTAQGMTGQLVTNGFDLDGYLGNPFLVGPGEEFLTGVNARFTAEGFQGVNLNVEFSAVPEPATLTLLGIGALALVGSRWRPRRLPCPADANE